jgi:hypothetical protein
MYWRGAGGCATNLGADPDGGFQARMADVVLQPLAAERGRLARKLRALKAGETPALHRNALPTLETLRKPALIRPYPSIQNPADLAEN